MPKINFIGIGAQKCGTTWLDACLRQHPDIYLYPNKEAHFFDRIDRLEKVALYESLFQPTTEKTVGEITPSYIFQPHCARLIHEYNPNIKLLAILRDPADRAVSQYRMEMSRGSIAENDGLWDAFERGLPVYGPMRERGHYGEQLKRYFDVFPKSQIRLLKYVDIKNNPASLIRSVFRFLGVDDSYAPSALFTKVQPVQTKRIDISVADIEKVRAYYKNRG